MSWSLKAYVGINHAICMYMGEGQVRREKSFGGWDAVCAKQ